MSQLLLGLPVHEGVRVPRPGLEQRRSPGCWRASRRTSGTTAVGVPAHAVHLLGGLGEQVVRHAGLVRADPPRNGQRVDDELPPPMARRYADRTARPRRRRRRSRRSYFPCHDGHSPAPLRPPRFRRCESGSPIRPCSVCCCEGPWCLPLHPSDGSPSGSGSQASPDRGRRRHVPAGRSLSPFSPRRIDRLGRPARATRSARFAPSCRFAARSRRAG